MPKYISGKNGDGILKEDNYSFEVVSAKLKESKKTGAEMIEIMVEADGVRIMDWLVFDGGSFTSARIDQFRTAIGEIILPGEEVEVLPGDLMRKTGRAHVIVEEWEGKKRNKIGSYLEPEEEIPGLKPIKKS